MFLLNLLPDAWAATIVHLTVLLGFVAFISGFILKRFPFTMPYAIPASIVGLIILTGGIYYEGAVDNEAKWNARIAELEGKIKESEAKAEQFNLALAAEREKKNQVIHDVKVVIKERLVEAKEKIDATCQVAPEAIGILNDSALNVKGTKK